MHPRNVIPPSLSGHGARNGLEVPVACVAVEPGGPVVRVPLAAERRFGPVDVVILMDTSSSAGFYFRGVEEALQSRIVPALAGLSEDARLSVATFNDFPEGECGYAANLPFRMIAPIGSDVETVAAAIDELFPYGGGTDAASNVEGLYQLATGAGVGPWVRPASGCPAGTHGYACFRRDALPVILHFADSPFHNGPGGSHPYADSAACPSVAPFAHDYDEAIMALRGIAARVVTFHPTGVLPEAIADFETLARDTRSTAGGAPLVFDLGPDARGLDEAVPAAMVVVAESAPLDVDAVLLDGDPSDGVDARRLVEGVVAARAEPMSGVAAIDREAGVFRGAVGSVQLFFELELRHTDGVPPGRYRVTVVFRADARSEIGRADVDVVVPGGDARCEG